MSFLQKSLTNQPPTTLLDYATRLLRNKTLVLLALMGASQAANAQKKPLDHTVYDEWQSIGYKELSNNGAWVAYQVKTQESDHTLSLFGLDNQKQLSFHRGEPAVFTADSQFAVFKIRPFYTDLKQVKIKKKKEHEIAKDSLGIVNLTTQAVEKLPEIKSFKVPKKGEALLAYLLEKSDKKEKTDKSDSVSTKKSDAKGGKKDKKDQPLELVLKNLKTGKKQSFPGVVDYAFSENGKQLVFATKPEKKDSTDVNQYGVYLVNTTTFVKQNLVEAVGEFKQFSFDEAGKQLAFLGTTDDEKVVNKNYQLYTTKLPVTGKITPVSNANMPKEWVFSENRMPKFSKNGEKLFFGTAPKPVEKDTTLIADDHAKVDIWHYAEDFIQPAQLKNLEREVKRSYLSVLSTNQPNALVQLAKVSMNQVNLVDEGNAHYALGIADNAYRLASNWDVSGRRDYYLVDLKTGKQTPFLQAFIGKVETSPSGKYILFFNEEDGTWSSFNVATSERKVLNKKLKVKFYDEENDMPTYASAYGIAYFTHNDETVLIKNRYDIWEFDLAGTKKPNNVTNDFGRKNQITFTINTINEEVKTISRDEMLYLSAFNNQNKQSGVYKTIVSKAKNPEQVVMSNTWGTQNFTKALDKDQYVYTKETYQNSPDVYVTNNFTQEQKISTINPQQNDYLWGQGELVEWKTYAGKKSKGVLYKPENFDPTKKYPMIVYFYEKVSDNLNRYQEPAPTRSRLNTSFFVSNGYLVFTPDISYETGYPGKAAEDYINSGVEHLKKNTWVDGDHIGIQGQSWGGYQVAHLITVTNLYAAAWSGAPVVNMTSAYGGIRWGTGMSRQFQYEQTQSRIGGDLWKDYPLYVANSPLFNMPNVTTPVAIMHNDQDGAVPWYQGIEMFMALRRLGKPAWLLNYNGDDHNLLNRANRNDIQKRQHQFFDHYLKGAPAPKWMTTGVPATLKGIDWGFEIDTDNP